MKRRAIMPIFPFVALAATIGNAAATDAPAIAAPQAFCVIPKVEPTSREFSCRVPLTKEGTVCECKTPDGRKAGGQVKIVLPPPNKPLD